MRAIRFHRGTWTAGNHSFDYRMRCSHCGVSYERHNRTAPKAITMVENAENAERPLSDNEQQAMSRLAPGPCKFTIDKAKRLKALRRIADRKRYRRRKR